MWTEPCLQSLPSSRISISQIALLTFSWSFHGSLCPHSSVRQRLWYRSCSRRCELAPCSPQQGLPTVTLGWGCRAGGAEWLTVKGLTQLCHTQGCCLSRLGGSGCFVKSSELFSCSAEGYPGSGTVLSYSPEHRRAAEPSEVQCLCPVCLTPPRSAGHNPGGCQGDAAASGSFSRYFSSLLCWRMELCNRLQARFWESHNLPVPPWLAYNKLLLVPNHRIY